MRFNGVKVGEEDARKYEDDWIASGARAAGAPGEADRREEAGAGEPAIPPRASVGETPVATPRFVSEAYFMDFKFEPGNYYLAGREQLEGHDVLKIEYYPTKMFSDDDTEKDDKREKREEASEAEARPPSAASSSRRRTSSGG